MKVKLKKYVIETVSDIRGNVIDIRYGYVIMFKLHWYSKARYICLLQNWYELFRDENAFCKVELKKHIRDATNFNDKKMDVNNKKYAKKIIELIKTNPERFRLE